MRDLVKALREPTIGAHTHRALAADRIEELEADLAQARLRLANMEFAWTNLRDSPQATPDIRAVAVGFVGEKA